MENQSVPKGYIAIVPMMDEMMAGLYGSEWVLVFVEELRERYGTGPDETRPSDKVIFNIYGEWLERLQRSFREDPPNLPAWPLIQGVVESTVVPDMANCLAKLTVLGIRPRMETTEVFSQLLSTLAQGRPKRGRPKDQELRAAITEGMNLGSTSGAIAAEMLDRFPDIYPEDDHSAKYRKMLARVKYYARSIKAKAAP